MSLQSLLFGYSGGCLESVDPELMARYDCDGGPVTMAMEAADMLHDIYMEAFYDTNDIEISAAMEGISVLTEASEKGSTFKEKVAGAWKKIKELFTRFVTWLKGILGSIWKTIKESLTKAKNFITGIPANIKSRLSKLEYEGFKYTNIDGYSKFAAKVDIGSKNYSKMTDKVAKVAADVARGKYEVEGSKDEEGRKIFDGEQVLEDMDSKLNESLLEIKKMFGIGADDKSEDVTRILFGYFRGGAKNADSKKKQTISVHDAESAVNNAEKELGALNKLFTGLQADYEFAAKVCEANEDRIRSSHADDLGLSYVLVNTQRKIASYSNMMNSFVSTVTNAWKSALVERNTVYAQAIAKAASEAEKAES